MIVHSILLSEDLQYLMAIMIIKVQNVLKEVIMNGLFNICQFQCTPLQVYILASYYSAQYKSDATDTDCLHWTQCKQC